MTESDIKIAKSVIKSAGGNREKCILYSDHVEFRKGETWNAEHKVVEILGDREPDGHRYGCEVDVVTRKITG